MNSVPSLGQFSALESVVNTTINDFRRQLQDVIDTPANQADVTLHQQKLTALQTEFIAFANAIKTSLTEIKMSLSRCNERIDDLEAYSRRNCLLFHGISETKDENILHVVEETLKKVNADNFDFLPSIIDRAHRLGKVRSTPEKPRPIIVKFVSYTHRDVIWKNKRNLKGTKILITESLTKARLDVYNDARAAFGESNTWTADGKIVIKISDKKKIVVIRRGELDQAITNYPSSTVVQPASRPFTRNYEKSRAKASTIPGTRINK